MRTELSFLTASVLLNAAMLYSIDHAALFTEKDRMAAQAKIAKQQRSGPIAFEYVESPKAPARKPPAKTSRISDRDAVHQDMTRDKAAAEGAPQVKTAGPSDQLGQKKGNAAPPPRPASPEVTPKTEQRPAPETPKPSGEAAQKDEILTPSAKQAQQEEAAHAYSPASKPSPPARPDEGQDRISTKEMSRTRSRGAQLSGMTSFEATGSGMGIYMKNLKEKIWLAWYPYLVTQYPRDFKSADAEVSFTLDKQGNVRIVRLVESKGSPVFAAFCMEAVQRAGSFGPLPQEILALVGKDELEIKFTFHYW